MKIPAKATKGEALQMIKQQLANRDLPLADQRKLKEQYKEVATGYAKGGDVVAKAPSKKQQAKVGKVMAEFKSGELHSGKGGKVVKNPKQAIAIALSEAKVAKPKKKK